MQTEAGGRVTNLLRQHEVVPLTGRPGTRLYEGALESELEVTEGPSTWKRFCV